MVTFRPLRYGHVLDARKLQKEMEQGTIEREAVDQYVFGLVSGWDFTDVETGDLIPLDQPRLLSTDQYNELMAEFNTQMEGGTKVKKTSNEPASYGRNGSRQVKRAATSHEAPRIG